MLIAATCMRKEKDVGMVVASCFFIEGWLYGYCYLYVGMWLCEKYRRLGCDLCSCTLSASNVIPFNVNFVDQLAIQPSYIFEKFLFVLVTGHAVVWPPD